MPNILELIVKSEDLFSDLNPENEQKKDRKFEKIESRLNLLILGFEKYCQNTQRLYYDYKSYKNYIFEAKKYVPDNYNVNDIRDFSKNLFLFSKEFKENSSWKDLEIYLNSVVQKTNHKKLTLDVSNFFGWINNIGYRNQDKEILVITSNKGDAGNSLGLEMSGGKIIVEGHVKNSLGSRMRGGVLIVNGDSGYDVGFNMISGEIHLNGNYISIYHKIPKGIIYHKGKKIIENGKIIPGAEILW